MDTPSRHIAIIDDNHMKGQFLGKILDDIFVIHQYGSGREALAEIPQLPLQCILLDIDMPEEDGFQVIARIKAIPQLAEVPVIFVTVLTGPDIERRGLESGAVDFVGNQFSPEIIRARVLHHANVYTYRCHLEERVREQTETIFELQDAIMLALSDIVELRDDNTAGHAQRTRAYVKRLIEQLQQDGRFAEELTEDFVRDLVRAAPLHDIGKIGVPDAILNKPGRLSREEFEEIKRHTIFGASAITRAMQTVHDSSFLRVLRDMNFSHHERWDGKGYPLGLDGPRIPLAGRIMAIADVYDALISRRPYKEPMSHEQAVAIIRDGIGTQFDPVVGAAFLACESDFRDIACHQQVTTAPTTGLR